MLPENESSHFFQIGEKEINHLKSCCPKLGAAIERIGPYQRQIWPDVFEALCLSIIGQQISVKAARTVSQRFAKAVGEITPENIMRRRNTTLQKCGMTMKKAEYIKGIARTAHAKDIDFTQLHLLSDQEIIDSLTELKGVGVWTVEMLLIFSLQRPNVLSFGDLAIRRALMKLHGHKEITKPIFARYQKRYSPYATTASLYLWAIAGEGIS